MPGRAVLFHVPEHVGNIQFVFCHELTARAHVFFRALGIRRVGEGLAQAVKVVVSFLEFCGGPVDGAELLHERHACLVQNIGDSFVARMQRLEILVGFGSKLIFLVKEVGICKRQFRINRVRA
jgi:hypothetical protein